MVSCIEVIEHLEDPAAVVRKIHDLLRPGGLFIFTTGNSTPHLRNLPAWYYITPEIHISFLSERTSRVLLQKAGFDIEDSRWGRGFADIYRYKILKTRGFKKRSALEKVVPWSIAASAADRRFRLSRHVIGWKADGHGVP